MTHGLNSPSPERRELFSRLQERGRGRSRVGGEVDPPADPEPTRLQRFLRSVREFLFGMMGMEFAGHALEMRGSLENLFMLGTVGEMIGVPILPPYYSLRLLPYMVPNLEAWKRRVLREREFTDEHDYHLEGL